MIYKFPIKNINGGLLAQELGVDFESVYCDEKFVYIDSTKTEKEIKNIFDKHTPPPYVNHRANALVKLAALGLTEDEIAAL